MEAIRVRLGAAPLEAVGAASFALWLIYILGGLPAAGVHVVSSEAEGAGDRRGGVGAAVTQGAYFSLIAAVLAFALAADPLVAAYLDYLRVTDPAVRAAASSYLVATAKWGGLPLCLDAVAFAEASEAFLNDLQDAEGDAYGAQFADYSTSVGSGGQSPSATMLGKARKDVERAQRSYAELLKLLAPLR